MNAETGTTDEGARFGWGTWAGLAVTLAGIVAIAILIITIDPLREAVGEAISGNTDELRDELRDLAAGPLIVFALCLIHAFLWYPTEIVNTASGFVYGFWASVPLLMAGWMANALLTWWLGQTLARPVLSKAVGEQRWCEAERMIASGGATLLLAVRLIPIMPFSLTGYVAGAARVPLGRFVWTSAVGYAPITIFFIYVGSRLDSFSPTDPAILAGTAVLIGLLFAARWVRRRASASGTADGGES
jgi:uncharacterized membrane protein YdjX (TVP38/TMEM64 family)